MEEKIKEHLPPSYGKCAKCGVNIPEPTDNYCWHCGKKLESKEFFNTIDSKS